MNKRISPKDREAANHRVAKKKQAVLLRKGAVRPLKEGDLILTNAAGYQGPDKYLVAEIKGVLRQSTSYPDRGVSESAVDSITDRATDVIGDRGEAMHWLGTPVRGLDFATPISLLETEEGALRVNDILGQMEHGIW